MKFGIKHWAAAGVLAAGAATLPSMTALAETASSSVYYAGGLVEVVGSDAHNRVHISELGDGSYHVQDFTGGIHGRSGCTQVDRYTARCGESGVETRFLIDLGAGNDNVFAHASIHAAVYGRDGNDGVFRQDTWDIGSRIAFQGGPGDDTVVYEDGGRAVRVSLNGLADDGGPRDQDNIAEDVEAVIGSPFDDVLVGNDRDNVLSGLSGADTVLGHGGNDRVIQVDLADRVTCGDGIDTSAPAQFPLDDCENIVVPPPGPTSTQSAK